MPEAELISQSRPGGFSSLDDSLFHTSQPFASPAASASLVREESGADLVPACSSDIDRIGRATLTTAGIVPRYEVGVLSVEKTMLRLAERQYRFRKHLLMKREATRETRNQFCSRT